MASVTGIPEVPPIMVESLEDEPLLGDPRNATQHQDESIARNLLSGTCDR